MIFLMEVSYDSKVKTTRCYYVNGSIIPSKRWKYDNE